MRRFLSIAAAAALSVSGGMAQSSLNVDLLGRLDGHRRYSDVWGHVGPNGAEYALLATDTGTSVIDCSVPTAPVERGFFAGPVSDLRDIKVYRNTAYVVSERGGGMQIIDLTDPAKPVLVGVWGTAWFNRAHNVAVDAATGWIYAVGTDVGTVVMDGSANPRAPLLVGVYGSASVTDYIHDLTLHNGVGHAAMIWNGVYRLLDVSRWPFSVLSEQRTAAAFTHNCAPRSDGRLAVTTDEQEGGLIQLWDVSDPRAPVALSVFSPNTAAIPHNAYLVGDLCHVSWFTEGYRLIDVSDPTAPQEIGFYDAHSGPSGTSEGAFGCYPLQPSGLVYVSDRDDGLLVLRPHALRITHDALSDSDDEDGPYVVQAVVRSPDPVTAVDLHWSAGGVTGTVAAQPTGVPDTWAAAIPGQRAPARVSYFLTAADGAGGQARFPPPPAQLAFDVGRQIVVYVDDFEGPDRWSHGATGIDDWERGAPAGLGGTAHVAWLDAGAAHSGASAWGTDLGLAAGADGAHPDRTSSWLQSPPIATGGEAGLRLSLWRWLNVEAADRARITVNGQVVWQSPATAHTQDFRWRELELDVSSVLDGATAATLRFELQAGAGIELGGWNLDDVALSALGDCVPPRRYGTATAGSGGVLPRIDLSGSPRVGAGFSVDGLAMRGGANAALVLSPRPAALAVLGATLLVDPVGATVVPRTVAGAGTARVPLSVPNDPRLDDADLFGQWIVLDAGAPGGVLAASEGLRIRVCQR